MKNKYCKTVIISNSTIISRKEMIKRNLVTVALGSVALSIRLMHKPVQIEFICRIHYLFLGTFSPHKKLTQSNKEESPEARS